jgi:hypothetical protein
VAVVDHLETLSGDVVGIPSVLPLKAYVSGGLGEKKKKRRIKSLLFCNFRSGLVCLFARDQLGA